MKHSKITNTTKEENYIKVEFENSKGQPFDYEIWIHGNEAGMARNNIDYAGLSFENKILVDYDMAYELSANAIATIRKAGFTVPKDFEPNFSSK